MSFTLRLATLEDAAACAAVYAPYVRDTCISFELTPPDAQELGQRMTASRVFAPWLVAEERGGVIGYAYGTRFRARAAYDWTVEVSVYVAQRAHGRGVGRGLYQALLQGLREQGFRTAIAGIALPNAASVALHEQLGFSRVAVLEKVGFKHGRWHDIGYWELELASRVEAPAPTLPVDAVRWAELLRAP